VASNDISTQHNRFKIATFKDSTFQAATEYDCFFESQNFQIVALFRTTANAEFHPT
jgi:hypothetical protein